MASRAAKTLSGLAVLTALVLAAPAHAHPHVWVTMRTQLVYSPDGLVKEIRHSWTFDEMFSSYATMGIPAKVKDAFTRDELAALAEVNVTSLQEYDYFTVVKAGGKPVALSQPVNYWLDYKDGVLTLNFTLPVAKPLRSQALTIEVYDPLAFVDFTLNGADAVAMAGAPPSCKLTVERPRGSSPRGLGLGESFFNALTRSSTWSAQFAQKISVQCS